MSVENGDLVPKSGTSSKSVLTGYVFVINFMMGAGVLALPAAFVAGGWGVSIIMAVVVNFIAVMTFFWLAEVQARAAILRNALKKDYVGAIGTKHGDADNALQGENPGVVSTSNIFFGPAQTPMPETLGKGPITANTTDIVEAEELTELREEDLMEVGDMCMVWFGARGKAAWSVLVLIFQMVILWVYAVGWAESVLVIVPIPGLTKRLECNPNAATLPDNCVHGIYVIYGVLFVLMVPLVMKNWSWMHYVQKFLIVLCYVATIAMIVTATAGIFTRPYESRYTVGYQPKTDAPSPVPTTNSPVATTAAPTKQLLERNEMAAQGLNAAIEPHRGEDSQFTSDESSSSLSDASDHTGEKSQTKPYVQPLAFAKGVKGFAHVFGILILVDIGQQGCALMMRQMPLNKVKKTFTLAFTTITLWLIVLGLPVALYMGDDVNALVTLNFAAYEKWGLSGGGGAFIGTLIAAYPVCSTSAAYMLNVINMAEAIESLLPLGLKKRICLRMLKRDYEEGKTFPFQLPIRIMIMIFSIILGFASYQFSKPLAVAGVIGFFIFLFTPVALEVQSQRVLQRLGLPTKTQYDTPFISNWKTAVVIGFVGIGCFVYYIISQLIPTFDPSAV